MFARLTLLSQLLVRHPAEFYDRLSSWMGARTPMSTAKPHVSHDWSEKALAWEQSLHFLSRNWGDRAQEVARESPLIEFEEELRSQMKALIASGAPIPAAYTADFAVARFCYVVCRLARPSVVVETGVAYGGTTSFILKSLNVNGRGMLHSIELPPLVTDVDRYIGCLVPEQLKDRWRLHRGASKRVIPRVAATAGSVDLFLHDSDHSYANMRAELDAMRPFLAADGIVMADDVDTSDAWPEWIESVRPAMAAVLQQTNKHSLFGFCVLSRVA